MQIWTVLTDGVLATQLLLALPTLYLCLLAGSAVAATQQRRGERQEQGAIPPFPYPRFAVVVPAHDEETMIGALLASLVALTYPRDRYTVYVVADNCTDRTAEIARGFAGVEVLERSQPADRGKGYALAWAFRELRARQVGDDAYVVLDADSVVEPALLEAFAVALAEGARAAQARYTVLNPLEAPSAALRWLALTLMNHVRPLGRNTLGASATLVGNGMCLTRALLERHPWRAFGVTEDYEYYLELVLHGERVRYVPEAVVRAHMPTAFKQLQTQDIRWESSSPTMAPWRIGWRLLWCGLRARDLVRLEALAELATPPLSSLVGASALTLAVALLLRSPLAILLGVLVLVGIAAYAASALYLLRPSRAAYRMFAYAPLYMARKLWVRLVLRRKRAYVGQWVRTARPSKAERELDRMEPIRLAQVTFDYYPFDVRVRRLAEAAAVDGGCAVDVICLRGPGEHARDTAHGVTIYRVPQGRGFGQGLLRSMLAWCWFLLLAGVALTLLHLHRRYDVIHVHNMPDFLVFCALVPKLLGARVILDVQDVSPELTAAKAKGRLRTMLFRLAELQEQLSARFADAVVTVGWPFEQRLRQRGIPASKLSIILNSTDPCLFPPSRRCAPPRTQAGPDQPLILMYWGTIAERHGLDIAIRALAQARESVPALRLDIMGRGEQIPLLKALAAQLGIAEHVRFFPEVPSDKIVDFVVRGDIGIIPYRSDGFADLVLPTKAYELAWMERPIIAADTPAMRSMFQPEAVLFCTPGDPRSFAAAIVKLARSPAVCEQMVAAAAADYARYDWRMQSSRYQQLLLALSRRGAQPRGAPA